MLSLLHWTVFNAVKIETEVLHYVIQDTSTMCTYGTARYQMSLANSNYYELSEEFMTEVCQLPVTYNKTKYKEFIDDWGTVMTAPEVSIFLNFICNLICFANYCQTSIFRPLTLCCSIETFTIVYTCPLSKKKQSSPELIGNSFSVNCAEYPTHCLSKDELPF